MEELRAAALNKAQISNTYVVDAQSGRIVFVIPRAKNGRTIRRRGQASFAYRKNKESSLQGQAGSRCKGPMELVGFYRSGGKAGSVDYLTVATNGRATLTTNLRKGSKNFALSKKAMRKLKRALKRAKLPEMPSDRFKRKPMPNAFQYSVTHKGKTVMTGDGAVPKTLEPSLIMLRRITAKGRNAR